MSDLYILGTGVLAEEVFALLTHAGQTVAGFVENFDPTKPGKQLCGRPIVWVDDIPNKTHCLCALSTTQRTRYIQQVQDRVQFSTFIHPSSLMLPGSFLGEGSLVSTGVLIASNTRIGRHVFINRGARIGHHTQIADFVTVQPGANIAGLVEIGEQTYIGMGAIVIERLKIGRGVTIAAGAVVTEDVPDDVMVAGNPAVIKKENVSAR